MSASSFQSGPPEPIMIMADRRLETDHHDDGTIDGASTDDGSSSSSGRSDDGSRISASSRSSSSEFDSDSDDDSSIGGNDNNNTGPALYSPADVIARIEEVTLSIVDAMHSRNEPVLTTPSSVRAGRTASSSRGAATMDEDGIYGGILAPSKSKSTTISNAAAAPGVTKNLNLNQCRSFTNVLLVLSFVHTLLKSNRTTTTREVYYHHVTHFRSQRECDAAILDCANLLRVPRIALGLAASPKGWFCGCVEIIKPAVVGGDGDNGNNNNNNNEESVVDGTALSSVQGLPITREWIDRSTVVSAAATAAGRKKRSRSRSSSSNGNNDDDEPPLPFRVTTRDARCILVIEKEGVYTRLSEDKFYNRHPCILVTGKGYPDLATRALVHTLHTELNLPVYGICDCNPYGISVLQTYLRGSEKMGLDGSSRYGVPIQWAGLRPSQVARLRDDLPGNVFQSLSELDRKKLEKLGGEASPFLSCDVDGGGDGDDIRIDKRKEFRRRELRLMAKTGCKVELESLHWLGMDYMCNWLEKVVVGHEEYMAARANEDSDSDSTEDDSTDEDDDEDDDDDESEERFLRRMHII